MKWEDRREGVFKFLKSEAVAQMWGQKKKNSSMTYEKLSRAMRWVHAAASSEDVDVRTAAVSQDLFNCLRIKLILLVKTVKQRVNGQKNKSSEVLWLT